MDICIIWNKKIICFFCETSSSSLPFLGTFLCVFCLYNPRFTFLVPRVAALPFAALAPSVLALALLLLSAIVPRG